MNILVELPNHGTFWLLTDDSSGELTEGPLAPISHVDEDGDVADLGVALFATSYAHLFESGLIQRFGDVIGSRDDLRVVRRVYSKAQAVAEGTD